MLVYQRTGSALLSALTFVAAFAPYLFGGMLLSALVDRLAPKQVLIGCDLLGAALVAVIAIPGVPLPAIYAALLVIGAVAPIRGGSAGALVAEILPGDAFVAGRSIQRISAQGAQVAGAAVGGILVAPLGPPGALLADSATFLISATLVGVGVHHRVARGSAGSSSLLRDSVGGIRAVWSDRPVRTLLLLSWAVSFVAVAPEALAAPAVAQTGHSPSVVGLWMAAIPAGIVVGDVISVRAFRPAQRELLTWPLALAVSLALAAFVLHPPLLAALALLFASGAASAYGLGLDQTLRRITQSDLLGRMYALSSTGLMVVQGIGFAAAGALGDRLGARTTIAAEGALGVALVAVIALGAPGAAAKLRRD